MTSLAEVVAQQPPKGGACSGASRPPVSFVVFHSIPASNASTVRSTRTTSRRVAPRRRARAPRSASRTRPISRRIGRRGAWTDARPPAPRPAASRFHFSSPRASISPRAGIFKNAAVRVLRTERRLMSTGEVTKCVPPNRKAERGARPSHRAFARSAAPGTPRIRFFATFRMFIPRGSRSWFDRLLREGFSLDRTEKNP